MAEMGSRRVGEQSAVAAARAAFIVGFGATSNLEAGRSWGIPTMGTAAHAFTLLHDSEEAAFQAQVDALGPGTTLLVDTYDIPTAVAREHHQRAIAELPDDGFRLSRGEPAIPTVYV